MESQRGKLQLLKRPHVIVVAFIDWNWGWRHKKKKNRKSLKLNITPSMDVSPSMMVKLDFKQIGRLKYSERAGTWF